MATNRVYRYDAFGSLDELRLHDEPVPVPQRGELLLRVHAVSLNFRDVAVVQGTYPAPAEPGHIPMSDGAAEVVAVGEGAADFKPGDRVIGAFHARWLGGQMPAGLLDEGYGTSRDGWLAEHKVVPQESVVALPESLTYEQGATLPCAATTAWTALSGPTPIRAGHTVLTQGTGGVSLFAVQLAKAVGARVIATTSSAAKAERLRAMGADEVINYNDVPEWGERAKQLTGGRGVDRVVDVGGPSTVGQSIAAVGYGGEVILVGFLGKADPTIDFFALFASGAAVRPIFVGDRAALRSVARTVDAAGIRPVIDRTFAFDDARDAFAHLRDAKHVGKIVIKVAG